MSFLAPYLAYLLALAIPRAAGTSAEDITIVDLWRRNTGVFWPVTDVTDSGSRARLIVAITLASPTPPRLAHALVTALVGHRRRTFSGLRT